MREAEVASGEFRARFGRNGGCGRAYFARARNKDRVRNEDEEMPESLTEARRKRAGMSETAQVRRAVRI